jgi:predicted N-acetyltransferase YhbS
VDHLVSCWLGLVKIRRIGADERLTLTFPLQAYAFDHSPQAPAEFEKFRESVPYNEGNLTLVAEADGAPVACASAIPMRQNVRGTAYPMAGIGGVATHPLARRQGHVRALMTDLLGRMRDEGHAVSALYPFRPSFYARFGYIGLPQARSVTFVPGDLGPLLGRELPGEVAFVRIRDGYDTYRALLERFLADRHGFATFPDYRAVRLRDEDGCWLATAQVGGEVIGAVTYRITGHAGELVADHLLATTPLARALLLQFFARHVDQVTRVVATVAPDELPELWEADLGTVTEARATFPENAPMARVLSVDALAGIPAGEGRVAIEVPDDPFIAGRYLLDGGGGALTVERGTAPVPVATVTTAGLSGLVYGVLDPDDVTVRGLGAIPPDAAAQLRALWPRRVPYLAVGF